MRHLQRRRTTPACRGSLESINQRALLCTTVNHQYWREGLYSSHLTPWKRQRKPGELDALTAHKRGPKVVVSSLVKENRVLQADVIRLTRKLKNAELIIQVQKKVAALLGNPIPNIQIDEENA
jgi:hypothetical protein